MPYKMNWMRCEAPSKLNVKLLSIIINYSRLLYVKQLNVTKKKYVLLMNIKLNKHSIQILISVLGILSPKL